MHVLSDDMTVSISNELNGVHVKLYILKSDKLANRDQVLACFPLSKYRMESEIAYTGEMAMDS